MNGMEVHHREDGTAQVTIGLSRKDVVWHSGAPGVRPFLRREPEEWLVDEVGTGNFTVQRATFFVGVTFCHEKDALLFLMRWQ